MGCGPAEVTLAAISVDGKLQASGGVLGAFFPVNLEGVHHHVRCIVWLLQVLDRDLCCLLKRLS